MSHKRQKNKESASSSSHSSNEHHNSNSDRTLNAISLEYPYEELRQSTDGFSPTSKIGQGAYGNVYRAVLRDGNEVAIKYLHGGHQAAGFEEEVKVLSKFRHQNLVILMGFSRHGSQRLLVYELLPGGDVGSRLQKGPPIGWRQRLNIAFDAACGLSHLHNQNPKVFHRDIKSANILLDRNGTAKWGDFGLACLSAKLSHKVHQTAGTVGYADPKYISTAIVTENTEVYSYGWVLIELVTAKPPAVQHHDGRISYFFSKLKDPKTGSASLRNLLQYADESAGFPEPIKVHLAKLALRCINPDESVRPDFRSMVLELRKLSADCDAIYPNGFVAPSTARFSNQLSGGQLRLNDTRHHSNHQGGFNNSHKQALNVSHVTPSPHGALARTFQAGGLPFEFKNFTPPANEPLSLFNGSNNHHGQRLIHAHPWHMQPHRSHHPNNNIFPKDIPLSPPAANSFFSNVSPNPSDFVDPISNPLSPPIYRSTSTSFPQRESTASSHLMDNHPTQPRNGSGYHSSVMDSGDRDANTQPIRHSADSESLLSHRISASIPSCTASNIRQAASSATTSEAVKVLARSGSDQVANTMGAKATASSSSVSSAAHQPSQLSDELADQYSERIHQRLQSRPIVDRIQRHVVENIGTEQRPQQGNVQNPSQLKTSSVSPDHSFGPRVTLSGRVSPALPATALSSSRSPSNPVTTSEQTSSESSGATAGKEWDDSAVESAPTSRTAFSKPESVRQIEFDRRSPSNTIIRTQPGQSSVTSNRQMSTLTKAAFNGEGNPAESNPSTVLTPRPHDLYSVISTTRQGFPSAIHTQPAEPSRNRHISVPSSSRPVLQTVSATSRLASQFGSAKSPNNYEQLKSESRPTKEDYAKSTVKVFSQSSSSTKQETKEPLNRVSSASVEIRQEKLEEKQERRIPQTARPSYRGGEGSSARRDPVRIELPEETRKCFTPVTSPERDTETESSMSNNGTSRKALRQVMEQKPVVVPVGKDKVVALATKKVVNSPDAGNAVLTMRAKNRGLSLPSREESSIKLRHHTLAHNEGPRNAIGSVKQDRNLQRSAKVTGTDSRNSIAHKTFKTASTTRKARGRPGEESESDGPVRISRNQSLVAQQQRIPRGVQRRPTQESTYMKLSSRQTVNSRRTPLHQIDHDAPDSPLSQFSIRSAGSERSVATPVFGLDDELSMDRRVLDSSEDELDAAVPRLIRLARPGSGKMSKTINSEKQGLERISPQLGRQEMSDMDSSSPQLSPKRSLTTRAAIASRMSGSSRLRSGLHWTDQERYPNESAQTEKRQIVSRASKVNDTSSSLESVPRSQLASFHAPTASPRQPTPPKCPVHLPNSRPKWDNEVEVCTTERRRKRPSPKAPKSARQSTDDLQRSIGVVAAMRPMMDDGFSRSSASSTVRVPTNSRENTSRTRTSTPSRSAPSSRAPASPRLLSQRVVQGSFTQRLDFADSASSDASAELAKIQGQVAPESLPNPPPSPKTTDVPSTRLHDVMLKLNSHTFTAPTFQISPMCPMAPLSFSMGTTEVSTEFPMSISPERGPTPVAPRPLSPIHSRSEEESEDEKSSEESDDNDEQSIESVDKNKQIAQREPSNDSRPLKRQSSSSSCQSSASQYSSSFPVSVPQEQSTPARRDSTGGVNPLMVTSDLTPILTTASSLLRDSYADFPSRNWRTDSSPTPQWPSPYAEPKPLRTGFSWGLCSTASGGSIMGASPQSLSSVSGLNSFETFSSTSPSYLTPSGGGCGMMLTDSFLTPCLNDFSTPIRADVLEHPLG